MCGATDKTPQQHAWCPRNPEILHTYLLLLRILMTPAHTTLPVAATIYNASIGHT